MKCPICEKELRLVKNNTYTGLSTWACDDCKLIYRVHYPEND